MPTIWTKDDVAQHGASDGNVTTEVVGSSVRNKLWSDLFGSSIDSTMWQQFASAPDIGFAAAVGGSVVESGGQVVVSIPINEGGNGRALEARKTFAAGVAIDVSVKVNYSVADTLLGFTGGLVIWDGAGQDYVKLGWFRDGASLRLQASKVVGGGATTIGTFITADADLSLRITRTALNVWEFFYDLAGGTSWTSLGTTTEDYASTMKACLFASSQNDAQTVTLNFTEFKQDAGGIFWPDQDVILANRSAAHVQFPTFAVTSEVGSIRHDYSTNAGVSFTGTLRTTAQMAALPNLDLGGGGQFQPKVRLGANDSTALASFDQISIVLTPATEGGPTESYVHAFGNRLEHKNNTLGLSDVTVDFAVAAGAIVAHNGHATQDAKLSFDGGNNFFTLSAARAYQRFFGFTPRVLVKASGASTPLELVG